MNLPVCQWLNRDAAWPHRQSGWVVGTFSTERNFLRKHISRIEKQGSNGGMTLDACGTNPRYGHPSGNRVDQTADPPEKDASHICTLV